MLKEALMLYSGASELVKKELKSEGLDPSLYSLHRLRSGVGGGGGFVCGST